jgi:fibronectin type 3 domain-containing protein
MKQLIKLTSSILLIALLSGCNTPNSLGTPAKPNIDSNIQSVDSTSLKTISDMNAIAFEWKKVDEANAHGYYLYRTNMSNNGTLNRVATMKNRYTTHYVDTGLEPQTQYMYSISTRGEDGTESRQTPVITVETLPRFESVSYITAISDMPRQIKILWRPHESQRVKYYLIEKTNPTTAKWERVAKVKGRLNAEYIDDDLKDNEVFSYRLTAITFDGIKSIPSQIVKAKTKALPQGINLLKASQDLPKKIVLTWEASKTPDVVSYNIYASTSNSGRFSKIVTLDAQTTSYTHIVTKDGQTMFYKITSIDKDGLETNKEMTPVMGATLGKPAMPTLTLAQIQGEKAILNWIRNDDRTVSFNIKKTILENWINSKTITIKGITDLRYEDRDIVRGVTYKYSIQAVDENGITSELTEPTQLVLPKLDEI